jgi:hypothetical protein
MRMHEVMGLTRRALTAAVAVAALLMAAPALAQTFKVRPIEAFDLDGFNFAQTPKNIDVGVGTGGGVTLGYSVPVGSFTGPATLSVFGVGAMYADRRALPTDANVVSMRVSDAGYVSYASSGNGGPSIVVGSDLTDLGLGVVDSAHPDAGINSPLSILTYALDQNSRPAVAGLLNSGERFLSKFDPATTSWTTRTVATLGGAVTPYGGYAPQGLAFDAQNRSVVGYNSAPGIGDLRVMVNDPTAGEFNIATGQQAFGSRGVSIATTPSGEIGFAFVNPSQEVVVGIYDGASTTYETVATVPTWFTPRSLAYDESTGEFVLARTDGLAFNTALQALTLSRRTAPGVWSDTAVGVDALHANLTFDAAGHAYLGAVTPQSISLITDDAGFVLPQRGDFDLSSNATAVDAPGFVQALRDEPGFLAANAGLTGGDVLALGDFTGDFRFLDDDARAALDDDALGFGSRKAGYVAFDNESSTQGFGLNLFGVTLTNPSATYDAGDARADLTGRAQLGEPDGTIGAADIDYVFAQIPLAGSADARANLNDDIDSVIDLADTLLLIEGILETRQGDVTLDGVVDGSDLTTLAGNWQQTGGWADGDANGDGVVNEFDLSLMALNWNFGASAAAPGFAEALASVTFVPEPGTAGLMLLALPALVRRRCRRRSRA